MLYAGSFSVNNTIHVKSSKSQKSCGISNINFIKVFFVWGWVFWGGGWVLFVGGGGGGVISCKELNKVGRSKFKL